VTVDKLPNEVLFNILEKIQDHKGILYNCLLVSKRWYDLALRHLWYDLEICLWNKQQMRLLKNLITANSTTDLSSLSSEVINPNFPLVRSLFLSISLRDRVVTAERCLEIAEDLGRYIVLMKACPGVRILRLNLHPFVESDAHISQWETLSASNALIMDLVQVAATREYSSLFLDIAQQKFRYNEELSLELESYVQALQSQITRFHLCETASMVWTWFPPLTQLRRLDFENMGNPGERALSKFWDTIAQFPLEELCLSGINFPHSTKFKNWESLRRLRLNQFSDVDGSISTILQTFPNLHTVGFHNPSTILPSKAFTPVSVTKIACTNLRQIMFTRCQAQKNILSLVAKSCPSLQTCMPPDNTSDNDIITLIDSCPFLTTLLIDCCTDLTSLGIHYIPRAGHLRSLMFNFQHLVFLDEECILALADNCPDLHRRGCRIAAVGKKDEKYQRILVREKLSGSSRFKRWFIRFVAWKPEGPPLDRIMIDMDGIRREIDDGT
jgi:hypothetical protein